MVETLEAEVMAKTVINSKFIGPADPLTEMLVGQEGAIRLPEVRVVVKGGYEGSSPYRIGLYGVAVAEIDPTNHDGKLQMWDGEVILLPRKKYRVGFKGKRADQILCSGSMGNPECWEELIWELPNG